MSASPKQVRTLIVNGEPAVRAQLHRLRDDRQDLAVIPERAEPHAGAWPPQIIGEKSGRIYFLDPQEVEYLASAGNYVVAHIGGNEFLARATLKRISARLAPLGFVQIERSLLVNLRRVAHVERYQRGQFCFVMRSGARLVSSRERGGAMRSLLLGALTTLL